MNKALCLMALAGAWLASACTVQVHEDYPKYLENNRVRTTFPKVADTAKYYLDPATERHRHDIKSVRAGLYLNTWEVEFGRIMDATMDGDQVRSAFRSVEKVYTPAGTDGLLLVFDLEKYEFRGFEARVALRISAQEDGRQLLSKTYRAKGRSQGGKIVWGGSLAMKNAVQQSTKSALDKILLEFVLDLNKAVAVARLEKDGEAGASGGSGKGIGRELDELERNKKKEAEEEAHTAQAGEAAKGKEPESESGASGDYCREYQSTVTIDGRIQETYGTACRQPDGNWRIVN